MHTCVEELAIEYEQAFSDTLAENCCDFNTVHKYQKLEILSKTPKSTVFILKDSDTGELKIMKETCGGLSNEYRMLLNLKHEGIPKLLEGFKKENNFFIIEEYIKGETLEEKLKKQGCFDERQTVEWAISLCGILKYLHEKKPYPVIHRDIKPLNIICTDENTLKLIDFGSAREYKTDAKRDTQYFGTVGYAAPEQFGFSQTDPRSDIYSLGILMYQLLTGRLPRRGELPLPVRRINKEATREIEKIIMKCSMFNPLQRYGNIDELLEDLNKINRKKSHKKLKISIWISVFMLTIISKGMFLGNDSNYKIHAQNITNMTDEAVKKTDTTGKSLPEKENHSEGTKLNTANVVALSSSKMEAESNSDKMKVSSNASASNFKGVEKESVEKSSSPNDTTPALTKNPEATTHIEQINTAINTSKDSKSDIQNTSALKDGDTKQINANTGTNSTLDPKVASAKFDIYSMTARKDGGNLILTINYISDKRRNYFIFDQPDGRFISKEGDNSIHTGEGQLVIPLPIDQLKKISILNINFYNGNDEYNYASLVTTQLDSLMQDNDMDSEHSISFTKDFSYNYGERTIDNTDYSFVDDPEILGNWQCIDYIKTPEEFDTNYLNSRHISLFFSIVVFAANGQTSIGNSTWTKGYVIDKSNQTASKYLIKEINGTKYLFMEWKNGDYTFKHMQPEYYVFKKVN